MNVKHFDHYLAFWQHLAKVKNQKPTPSHPRVSRAKASLKSVLVKH